MAKKIYEELKRDVIDAGLDVIEDLGRTKRLHISMAYIYVGDTGIDIPMDLLEGRSEEEQLKIAYEYAQNHLGEIPVARNAEYIANSDSFEIEDIDFG